MTLDEINAEIARLELARKEAAEARAKAIGAALAAFVMEYDYSVTWPHPAQFRVERQVTADCRARLNAFEAEWGQRIEPFVGGMTYSVLTDGENHYVEGGGGKVIVDFGEGSSFDPHPLAVAVLEELRAGRVPTSIRRG